MKIDRAMHLWGKKQGSQLSSCRGGVYSITDAAVSQLPCKLPKTVHFVLLEAHPVALGSAEKRRDRVQRRLITLL